MAKYEINYNCGHTGTLNLIGKVEDRMRIIEWKEADRCPECYREEENRKSAEAAKKMELPELTGSAKQVAYGTTCRQNFISKVDIMIEEVKDFPEYDVEDHLYLYKMIKGGKEAEVLELMQYLLKTRLSAGWWIDAWKRNQRMHAMHDFMESMDLNMRAEKKAAAELGANPEHSEGEDPNALVRPQEEVSDMIVDMRIVGNVIEIHTPERNDTFYRLAKHLKLKWSQGRWERKIISLNGTIEDRAAEIGHHILGSGFSIRIPYEKIREKAISGEYEEECTNWIAKRSKGDEQYRGWFCFMWDRDDDYYHAARRITGSRYSSPHVVVPPEYFDQVEDFAERYGFQFTESGREVLEQGRREKEEALMVNVQSKEKESVVADGKPPVLETPEDVNIDEELRDDN